MSEPQHYHAFSLEELFRIIFHTQYVFEHSFQTKSSFHRGLSSYHLNLIQNYIFFYTYLGLHKISQNYFIVIYSQFPQMLSKMMLLEHTYIALFLI